MKASFRTVSGGVPQGFYLGPLFFLLPLIICRIFGCGKLLFENDVSVYNCVRSANDYAFFQKETDGLFEWCYLNGFNLNVTKCKFISCTRKILSISRRQPIYKGHMNYTESVQQALAKYLAFKCYGTYPSEGKDNILLYSCFEIEYIIHYKVDSSWLMLCCIYRKIYFGFNL